MTGSLDIEDVRLVVSGLKTARSEWRERRERGSKARFPPVRVAQAVEHLAAAMFLNRLGAFNGARRVRTGSLRSASGSLSVSFASKSRSSSAIGRQNAMAVARSSILAFGSRPTMS